MQIGKLIVFSFFIVLFFSCKHTLTPEVENIVNDISETSFVLINFPEHSYSCEKLINSSTIDDLIYLTKHENVVVRYYAFSGLRKRNYPNIKEIYFDLENDFSIINTSNGACLRESDYLNNLILQSLDPEYFNSEFGFTKKEYKELRESLNKKLLKQ